MTDELAGAGTSLSIESIARGLEARAVQACKEILEAKDAVAAARPPALPTGASSRRARARRCRCRRTCWCGSFQMPDPKWQARGRRSKSRGKADERELARLLGCTRWPADTGKDEDLRHPTLSIQVKGGARACQPAAIALGLAQARAGAVESGKLPALALGIVVHAGRGKPKAHYLVFDASEWAHWSGCEPQEGE